jgi:hypothetical protein
MKLPLGLVAVGLALSASATAADTYIGAERCKTCHEFEYTVWSSGPHARAHQSLTEEQLKDPKCNNCHTMAVEKDATTLTSVQCERCHGAGKYYHPSYVMKDKELARAVGLIDPQPVHCMQCHTDGAPSIKPFDFAAMWAKIDHGKAAREKWEKQRKDSAAKGKSPQAKAP